MYSSAVLSRHMIIDSFSTPRVIAQESLYDAWCGIQLYNALHRILAADFMGLCSWILVRMGS